MSTVYLVERYLPGIEAGILAGLGERLTQATEAMQREGRDVEWLQSIGAPADESCICVFRAERIELVAEANERAGAGFDRISVALAVSEL